MEDIEREQFIEFIKQSRVDLISIQDTIDSKRIEKASYWIGKLVSKHETLLEALECEEEDEDYINKCSEACEMMDEIRALHKQASQCRNEENSLSEDELVIQKFLDGFKVVRRNANIPK